MHEQKTDTDPDRSGWSRRYEGALRRFLRQGTRGSLLPAARLGHQAVTLELETLDVAQVHEQALDTVTPPENEHGRARQEMLEWADRFFRETLVPIEATHRAARNADVRIDRLTRTLRERVAESSEADRQLEQAVAEREAVESSANAHELRHDKLLAEAQRVQKRLRDQMSNILKHQENKRKQIGGDLRGEIAQALIAIDLSLLSLKTSGQVKMDNIEKSIAEAGRISQEFDRQGREYVKHRNRK